jgi:glycyl-tRNA synthetase
MELHERIFELALTRSFFYQSNEPYGSSRGFYDYGPVGVLIRRKIEALWRRMFLREEDNLEIETSIITPEIILKASGHVQSFADPVVECKKCKNRVRADTLVEEHHSEKHGEKWDGKLESLDKMIKKNKIRCSCGEEFGHAYMFNLMFRTSIGGEQEIAFCRPETAQGIFTAFPRLFRNHGTKLPLAVGQIGKSFRNEISPRKGLVRMREFTQMELEYFFNPSNQQHPRLSDVGDEVVTIKQNDAVSRRKVSELVKDSIASNEIMAYYLARQWQFYRICGIPESKMHFRVLKDDEVPHYSKRNIDLEVETSYGTIETTGNAYRVEFDLSQHSKFSKKDFSVFLEEEKKKITPHVFELSMGMDRLFFCMLEHCFRDKDQKDKAGKWELGTAKEWEWFDFPAQLAPYEAAVFPLMKKDGLAEKAREVASLLRPGMDVYYHEGGSIGRRYARADEIGIPYALTVDYETLKDETVTIRYRNDGKQERIKISECMAKISECVKNNKVTIS